MKYTKHIIIDPRRIHPQVLLDLWTETHNAESAYYIQIYEGNLEERLELHTGALDVPHASKELINGESYSSYDINLDFHLNQLDKGTSFFQWVLINCSEDPESEDLNEDDDP